jgi:protease-4
VAQANDQADFFTQLGRELRDLGRVMADEWHAAGVDIRNSLRAMRGVRLDYVVLPVGGALPERSEPPRSFIERQLPLPQPPFSMARLNSMVRLASDADNIKGVVFLFRGFQTGLATLQNFRRSLERLRQAGKESVVFTPYVDLRHYYAATAADRIIIPPGAHFEVLGLYTEVVFLRNALERIGVQADVIQISPYKTAFDNIGKAEMTPEYRAQLDWLLDDQFDLLTAGMADGRQMSQEEMKRLIDQAPLTAAEALEYGLIDAVAYEDELPHLLAVTRFGKPVQSDAEASRHAESAVPASDSVLAEADSQDADKRSKARLKPWSEARPLLNEKARRRARRFIGVISLEGAIIMGPSRQPPIDIPVPFIGGAAAGEQTLVQLLRRAEKMDELAAVVFYVNSGGGSALASDLIGRQVALLNEKKPVLVYMGSVAASGGYYVAALTRYIMSQSGTVTGSIGVINAHLSTRDLYQKLDVNRVQVERGERAGLYSTSDPLSSSERQVYWESIVDIYDQFKQVVARGRNLPFEALDPICEGRVWTGRQALGHGLVDGHGDFVDALRKAAELAELPVDDQHLIPVIDLHPKGGSYVPPASFGGPPTAGIAAEISGWLSGERLRALQGPLMLLPCEIRLR